MLNAIALSLMGIQFLLPVALIALITIVPAIFALEVRLLPKNLWPLFGMSALLLSLLMFGLDIGLWTLVYLVLGMVYGLNLKLGWGRLIRVLTTGIACATLLGGVAFFLAWIIQLDWAMLMTYTSATMDEAPLLLIGIGGLIIWGLATAIGIEYVANNVYSRLRATQAGIVNIEAPG